MCVCSYPPTHTSTFSALQPTARICTKVLEVSDPSSCTSFLTNPRFPAELLHSPHACSPFSLLVCFIKGKGGCTELTTASLASPVFLKSPEESTGPECTRMDPNVPEWTRMDPSSYPEWTLLVHAHWAPMYPTRSDWALDLSLHGPASSKPDWVPMYPNGPYCSRMDPNGASTYTREGPVTAGFSCPNVPEWTRLFPPGPGWPAT